MSITEAKSITNQCLPMRFWLPINLCSRNQQEQTLKLVRLLIALLDGSELIIANVGDSRGVMMCDADVKTIPLSFDHKPDGKSEHKRIRQACQTVVPDFGEN